MTEREYIKATNLSKIRTIASIMKDIMKGDDYGVDKVTYDDTYNNIMKIQEELFGSFELKGE